MVVEGLSRYLVDHTGKIVLPKGQHPITRPPFTSERLYFQQLDNLGSNPAVLARPDLYPTESKYLMTAGIRQRHGSKRNLRLLTERLQGFWTPQRIDAFDATFEHFKKFYSEYVHTSLKVADLTPFVLIESPRYPKAPAITDSRSGVITLPAPETIAPDLYTGLFSHELHHFFSTRIVFRYPDKNRQFYRSGFSFLKGFHIYNEGVTEVSNEYFLASMGIETIITSEHPYKDTRDIVKMTEAVIAAKTESSDAMTVFKQAYFTGRMLDFARIIETCFKSTGGLRRYLRLVRNLQLKPGTNPFVTRGKDDFMGDWRKYALSAFSTQQEQKRMNDLFGSIMNINT